MTKAQIKKYLSVQLATISIANKSISLHRWEKAKAFDEINSMIVWAKSPYKSFRKFCKEQWPDNHISNIYVAMSAYRKMITWYNWTEIITISQSTTYSAVLLALPHIKRKRSVKALIALINAIRISGNRKGSTSRSSNTVFHKDKIMLSMVPKYVDKFEAMLVPHGYVIPKDSQSQKRGISLAMAKYLDTI